MVILVHCLTAAKLLLDEMSTWIGVLTIISQIEGQLPNMEDATLFYDPSARALLLSLSSPFM